MANRALERSIWQRFFDEASRRLPPTRVDVEIAGSDVGDQEALRLGALGGLAYDPKDDAFELVAEGIDHLVAHPRAIYVDEEGERLRGVMVEDDEGRKQFIRLSPPIALH